MEKILKAVEELGTDTDAVCRVLTWANSRFIDSTKIQDLNLMLRELKILTLKEAQSAVDQADHIVHRAKLLEKRLNRVEKKLPPEEEDSE
jgi:hypothetical protein